MSNAVEAIAASPSEPEWAALAAIDWADQKNFWRLLPAGRRQSEAGELDGTPEAVEVWAANLQQRFGGRPIAVILEQSRGALVYMLTKYPHLVLFPVHPTTAARYRETFAPSGAKSDPSDTDSLLDLLLRHRQRLRPLRPDTVETRLLHFLVKERGTRGREGRPRLQPGLFAPAATENSVKIGNPDSSEVRKGTHAGFVYSRTDPEAILGERPSGIASSFRPERRSGQLAA